MAAARDGIPLGQLIAHKVVGPHGGGLNLPGVGKQHGEHKTLVPGPQKGDDGHGRDAHRRHRNHHPQKGAGAGAAVHNGRVHQLPGKRVKEGFDHPDRQGITQEGVEDDQGGKGVYQVQLAHNYVERHQQGYGRHDAGGDEDEQEERRALEAVARKPPGREDASGHHYDGGASGHDERVQEVAGHGAVEDDLAVGLEADLLGPIGWAATERSRPGF